MVGSMTTCHLFFLFLVTHLAALSEAKVKCFDCVGKDCVGAFCEGDYCVVSKYAPRWGTVEWGRPKTIKGCIRGTMLRPNIADHCEMVMDDGVDVFSCFCSGQYCNGGNALRQLRLEPVTLYTCVCSGDHCDDRTCTGELCSYVVNHKTGRSEQGCINGSVPLIERRTVGSCMMPPITGAMHHTVARDAEDLLKTESCICIGHYCNAQKPMIRAVENQKCQAFVRVDAMGVQMVSRNISCLGEFCFKVSIDSRLGQMRHFKTIGCISFLDNTELAEEMKPDGCAKFQSEKVVVNSCFRTEDRAALARVYGATQPQHRLLSPQRPPTSFRPYIPFRSEQKTTPKTTRTTKTNYVFIKPTRMPVPDESNTTLVGVFVFIMAIIAISGVVWKFELHKKLFRANYDTVAGG